MTGCNPATAGGGPTPTSATGYFVYVANGNSNNVSAYTINTGSGALSAVGSAVASGANPHRIAVVAVTSP